MFGQYTFMPMRMDPPTWIPYRWNDYHGYKANEVACNDAKEKQIKEMEKKNPRLANQLKSVVAREKMASDFKSVSKHGLSVTDRTKASPKRGKKLRKKK
jgi:creatinine amidohydrolase/Fe(II)-dependent formamide hydrolase-like protein